ncbi:hypothetical protein VTJ04DRAFT_4263 [Mycothermus thermophilus]|uniref:uncharacterized protein n=1 Tax=Humicola insolens TaxID=85995 RepID=UPI003742EE8F
MRVGEPNYRIAAGVRPLSLSGSPDIPVPANNLERFRPTYHQLYSPPTTQSNPSRCAAPTARAAPPAAALAAAPTRNKYLPDKTTHHVPLRLTPATTDSNVGSGTHGIEEGQHMGQSCLWGIGVIPRMFVRAGCVTRVLMGTDLVRAAFVFL